MFSQSQRHGSDWSFWEWSNDYKCYTRWRKNPKGIIIWEYQQQSDQVHNSGNASSLDPVLEDSKGSQYMYDGRSGKDAMDNTLQQFSSTTLNSHPSSTPGPPTSFQTSVNGKQNYSGLSQYNQGDARDSSRDSPSASGSNWQSQGTKGAQPPKWPDLSNISSRTYERHDKNFKKCDSKKFKPGKVFKILWSEHDGTNGTEISTVRGGGKKTGSYEKIRRFVIVKNFEGHCTCFPILTYGGRATLKPGVHSEHHTVIYTDKTAGPRLLPGESLTNIPLRMEPNDNSQRLDPASRVNYAKLYTVEHNVKVCFIGALTRESQAQLGITYNTHHRLDEETDLEDSSLPQGPLRPYSNPSDHQQYVDLSSRTDSSYGGSRNTITSLRQGAPLATGTLSTYSNSLDINDSDRYEQEPIASVPLGTDLRREVDAPILERAVSQLLAKPSQPLKSGLSHDTGMTPASDSAQNIATEAIDLSASEAAQAQYRQHSDSTILRQLIDGRETPKDQHAKDMAQEAIVVDTFRKPPAAANIDGSEVRDKAINMNLEPSLSESLHTAEAARPASKVQSVATWLSSTELENNEAELDVHVAPTTARPAPLFSAISRLRRRSSVESLDSFVFSDGDSVSSSLSSLSSQQDGVERLIAVLRKDDQLKKLYVEAALKVDPETFTEKFRQCLIQCSIHLKVEFALDDSIHRTESIKCARAVRRYSRQAATTIGNELGIGGSDLEPREPEGDFSDDSDMDDQNDDPSVPPKDLQETLALESTLMSSAAYRLLKENLFLFLNPNPIKRALFTVWPVIHPRSFPLMIQYRVDWVLPSFLRSNFEKSQNLKDVLTITGQAQEFEARSCGDYLINVWPEVGYVLLDAIHILIRGNQSVETQNEHVVLSLNVLNEAEETSTVSMGITAAHAIHVKVASAVSWLCAALRPSPDVPIAYSTTSIEALKSKANGLTIQIRLNDLETLISDPSCWHPLFPSTVVAKGFPSRDRVEGRGLEISFGNMAMMGQSLTLVEHGGGLVLEGLRAFLIPTALLSDGSVQWHFEYKRQGNCRKPRKLFEVLRKPHLVNRYRTLDVQDLIGRRCFLGWADEVEVVIANESYSTKKMYWPQSDIVRGIGHLKSYGITTGTEGMGIWGVSANRTSITTSVPSRLTLEQDKDISDTLDDEFEARVMIYDTGTKIAHLLPQADVTLFLAHRILKRRQQSLCDSNGQAITLQFASTNVKALDILRGSLDFEMFKQNRGRTVVKRHFGNLVKEIWNALDLIENNLVSNEAEWATIDRGAPKFLHGVALQDLENMKSSMSILQAEVDKPWVHLAVTEPTIPVLFCEGLGQPIVPVNLGKLCESWIRVPEGCNYMVATCAAICSWLDRYDNGQASRLSERVEWHVDKRATHEGLIYCHSTKNNDHVHHEQQLSFVTKAHMNPEIFKLVMVFEKGGLIFGSTRLRRGCFDKLYQSAGVQEICSQGPSHEFESVFQQPSDVPEGSSDTSVEIEAVLSFDGTSNTPSLTSSQVSQRTQEVLSDSANYPSPISPPIRALSQPQETRESNAQHLSPSYTGRSFLDRTQLCLKRVKKLKKSKHPSSVEDEGGS